METNGVKNIYVYSDESGVFDPFHFDYYAFGGIIFLSEEEKNEAAHHFHHTVTQIRGDKCKSELKASNLATSNKYKLMKSISKYIIFGAVINLNMINKNILKDKKTKQRYLDFAYKMGLKNVFKKLIDENIIFPNDPIILNVYCDEHTTATDGLYELKESLEMEFKRGNMNFYTDEYFPPLFKRLNDVRVTYLDSKTSIYIRMADIIANFIYSMANFNLSTHLRLYIKNLPYPKTEFIKNNYYQIYNKEITLH